MIRLSDVISSIVADNPLLQFGLSHRLFNLSQLSKYLQPLIEVRAKKKVKPSAILMALSRLQPQLSKDAPQREVFQVEHIGIQTGLVTFTYPKTDSVHKGVQKLYSVTQRSNGYATISEATNQITLITEAKFADTVKKYVPGKPLFHHDNVASIAVTFDESYIEVPGMIYVIIQQTSLLGINIVEIASTFTELVLYVDEKDAKPAFDALYALFKTTS